MSENQAAAGGESSAKLDSEKSKDIRQTNIIAAKGKSPLTSTPDVSNRV